MSQGTSNRWRVVVPVVAVLVLIGGVTAWRLYRPERGRAPAVSDLEKERRRVAAFDPTFDAAKPTGGIAGVVKDAEGRTVAGAVVAATRQRGRDEIPAFSRPIPRVGVTGANG